MIDREGQDFQSFEPIPTHEPSQADTSSSATAAESPALNGAAVDGGVTTVATASWHAEAGRKGARRVHELIQEGKLYEQEHGLKSGRQRLRQLIELGKLYEQEHGLRPRRPGNRGQRLPRMEREELLRTLLGCLLRISKPSFRPELLRLAEALAGKKEPVG